jgi:outer membrane protein OmpA-like peptidoglycan-associated protein/tetratricopeptide (TPR) repeat protein
MKTLIISSIIIFSYSFVFAQKEVTFDKKNFKDNKKEFKEAVDYLELADELIGPNVFPRFSKALPLYKKAYDFNPKSAYLNFQIGLCYLNSVDKFKALEYFKASFDLNPNKNPDIHYFIGRGYHLQSDWDNAIKHYEAHKNRLDTQNELAAVMEVNKLIYECKSGKDLVKNPVRVWIDNMGKNINTEFPEYGMIMTADASEIFFTSQRPTTTGGGKDEMVDQYYEDVYTSNKRDSKDWSNSTNIGDPINTKGHDAPVALSPDGGKMIVYIDDKGDGNLYESKRVGNEWSKPKIFNDEICSPYHEASAWYSSDGKRLFFVSERPTDNRGAPKDRDIFVSFWNEDKEEWLDVKRLPDNINTKYDEDGIFLHPDGKTLYFSSKGHNSMGGYDIFKTIQQKDGSWSEPENIGYPVNTPDDDIFFVVAANGRDAYMTSFREGGFGHNDLYKVTLLGPIKEPILNSEDILLANSSVPVRANVIEPKVEVTGSQLAILKGIIRDDKTKEPLKANIELVDNETNEIIAEFSSDAKTGRYLVSLPGGKNYGIAVKAEGYLFHSENFDVTQNSDYKEVEKIIDLKKVDVGESIVLRNIFFDLNKYTLRSESEIELNRLTQLMLENPSLKIEIGGHTDSRGSAEYNKDLSKNRAKTVVEYLIDKGIDENRLEYAGYGEEQPINSDETISKMRLKSEIEAAHQDNRRTEFKILAN